MSERKLIINNKNFVIDRHDKKIPVSFDRIHDRIDELCRAIGKEPALNDIDAILLMQDTIARFRPGMKTSEIDAILNNMCISKSSLHPEYGVLSSRLLISNFHKETALNLRQLIELLEKQGDLCRLNNEHASIIRKYHEQLDSFIDHNRDYMLSTMGFQTLIRSYLMRRAGKNTEIVERPQYMYLRVAICTELSNDEIKYMNDHDVNDQKVQEYIKRIQYNYDMLSLQKISHASPTLYNSGMSGMNLASCFLVGLQDSLEAIMDATKDLAILSKYSGGCSLCVTPMRSSGSIIKSTAGESSGIGKFLKIFDAVMTTIDQSGKRPGSFAIYLEPWHADIIAFIQASRKTGKDIDFGETHNLKYAIWAPDLWMQAVEEDKVWYLMDPAQSPGLHLVHGEEFNKLYMKYVEQGKYVKKIKARTIAMEFVKSCGLTGVPYLCFKDNVNRKCNLAKIRTINASNLCAEITIPSYHDEKDPSKSEIGVCIIGAVPLANFVINDKNDSNPLSKIDFKGIMDASRKLVHNLDNAVDKNYYPLPACERSSKLSRPIGIGAAGLYDLFAKLKISFDMKCSIEVDEAIAAVIYYGALDESCKIGKDKGGYPSQFDESFKHKPELQPDMWVNCKQYDKDWELRIQKNTGGLITPEMWQARRNDVNAGYLRNSLLTAWMPTASTSNILSMTECFEPITSNIFTRQTLSGMHIVVNKYLINELIELGIWNEDLRLEIIRNEGSVQNIPEIPNDIKQRYKTARELDQRILTMHSVARGPFICQTQSLNYYFEDITFEKLWSVISLGHKLGLKTGSYYTHSSPAVGAQGTSLGIKKKEEIKPELKPEPKKETKSVRPNRPPCDENCIACSA